MTAESDGAERLLSVSDYELGRFRVLALSGDCDISTRDMLQDALAGALEDTDAAVIVDLNQVCFCDGASAARILAAGRTHDLVVCGINKVARRIFDILDPAGEVPRYRSVDTAAWSLSDLP